MVVRARKREIVRERKRESEEVDECYVATRSGARRDTVQGSPHTVTVRVTIHTCVPHNPVRNKGPPMIAGGRVYLIGAPLTPGFGGVANSRTT